MLPSLSKHSCSTLLLFIFSLATSTILPEPSQIDFSQIPLLKPNHAIENQDQYGTSLKSAKENANGIFNTLSSAMRQFGSSYHHNGMSLIPATVPKGINLYHGSHEKERVIGMEWLAFEIEHAEQFARSFPGPPPKNGDGNRDKNPPPENHASMQLKLLELQLGGWSKDPENPVGEPKHPRPPPGWENPGYLHTYRTNRPLNLLYIDGMGAAKGSIGTLDTQDILLLNHTNADPMDEEQRSQGLCSLPSLWKVPIDGFIRMEAGFEIIHCDFSTKGGLDFLDARKRPESSGGIEEHPEGYDELRHFEYMRGVSERYHGIDASRVQLRFEDMVSAYFYPANLTNPDAERGILPRLPGGDVEQMETMRRDLRDVLEKPGGMDEGRIDWQGMVDMIIARYAKRLQYIASSPGYSSILSVINVLLNTFINYSDESREASIERCTYNYFTPAEVFDKSFWTRQDHLLATAILGVSKTICETLFDVRDDLLSPCSDCNLEEKADSAVTRVKALIEYLDWSVWKECGKCGWNEVCFISMWPFGGTEDHFNPGCRNATMLLGRQRAGDDYWGNGRHW